MGEYLKYAAWELWHGRWPLGYAAWCAEWERYAEYLNDADMSWLCTCGHYQEDGYHCEVCGCQPPWGCDCGFCDDPEDGEWDDDYDILDWGEDSSDEHNASDLNEYYPEYDHEYPYFDY